MLVEVWGDVFEAIWMLSEERWGSWESGPCLLGDRPPPAEHTGANAGSDRIIMGSFFIGGRIRKTGPRVSLGDVVKKGVLYAARTHRGIDPARPPDDV